MLERNWFSILITILLVLLYFYLLCVPINLATADLGRHIKNGELLIGGNFDLLYRNYYSYTHPNFPFINHHWLGGILFYLTYKVGGLVIVQLLFITVSLLTFIIFFKLAKNYSNIAVSSVIALLTMPILAYRAEVRPEVFSYLFAGIYYFVFREFLNGQLNKKWLFLLPLIQLVWANTHIFFFVGIFITGVFWFQALFDFVRRRKSSLENLKLLTIAGALISTVSLLNPNFLNGLIYPLQILGNYGYRVLENQSIFFLEKIIDIPVLLYFKIVLVILVLSWAYKLFRVFRFKESLDLPNLIFSIAFSYLAITQIRNVALFGLFALVIISVNLKSLKLDMNKYLLMPALGIIFVTLLVINPRYWEAKVFGLSVMPNIERGAEFVRSENLKGPIFNNYDVGGYLIFNFYPQEKVFVDNRPEAYPEEFFTKIYIPMQEDESIWKSKLAEYNFNLIFFYRNDLTPWAQKFLMERVKDAEWAPVFVDNYNIIFLKRNEQNAEIIKKNELPKEIFKVN